MRRGDRGQAGFTLVEVLLASVLLVTAALATAKVMIGGVKVDDRAERNQIAIEHAQAELESMRTLSFEEVALTGPAPSTPPGGPGDRLTGTCASAGVSTDGCFALNEDGSNRAPLVVAGGVLEGGGEVSGAAVAPGPESFNTAGVGGTVYHYVVWQNDYACPESQCPGMQDRKRAIVVVQLDPSSSGEPGYREVQSDFIDPDLGKDIEPAPEPAVETTAQQLWLTDTPCDQGNRIFPDADHALHDTLGACDGADPPDLLLTGPPLLDPGFPAEQQPEYDLADDIEPVSDPESDTGLQVRTMGAPGCDYTPAGTDAHEKTHRWVTLPVPSGQSFVFEGSATLELWTQTLSGISASGKICAFLFVRDDGVGGVPVDTPIGDAAAGGVGYFTHSMPSWHSGGWGLVSIPMQLEPPAGESNVLVLPGQRIGLALSVEATGTGTDALQFAYEHPDFDSRLEVETATPLDLDLEPSS